MTSVELAVIIFFGLALIFAVWRLFSHDDSNRDSELRREIREIGSDQMHILQALGKSQQEHLAVVSENIEKLKEGNEKKLDEMRLWQ